MTSTPLSFTARSTEDLIAVAPILLGYHPRDAVVMVSTVGEHLFHGATALPPRAHLATDAPQVADLLVGPACRNGIRGVVFLFFSEDERVVRQVWRLLRVRCDTARLRVIDVVRVGDRRFYPLRGAARLREVGVPYDVSAHPFVVEAVLHGVVVHDDRAALVATADADPAACAATRAIVERERLEAAPPPSTGADRRRWGDWLQRLVRGHVDGGTTATTADVARMGWAAQDVRVRDAAWALIRRQEARRHQAFWLDVVRRTPDRFLPAPAALLGWSAWQGGDGALAWVALDRCLAVAPDYSMATLLARCLHDAVPPDLLDGSFAWDEGLPA